MKTGLTALMLGFCLSLFSQNEFPNLTIETIEGQTIDLNPASEQQMIILCFWATWCEPCIEELSLLEQKDGELNSRVIAISIDDSRTISRIRPMISAYNWKFEVVLDPNQEIKRKLNFINIPYTLVLYKKRVIYEKTGFVKGDEELLIEELSNYQNL